MNPIRTSPQTPRPGLLALGLGPRDPSRAKNASLDFNSPGPTPTSGFTLMETIVAFVVFTAIFIALERATALGWRGIRLARMDQSALTLARTKLATFGLNTSIPEETTIEGEENGLTWQLTAEKYKAPEATSLPPRFVLYWVTVTVSWRDRPMAPPRTIELTTLKSGAPE